MRRGFYIMVLLTGTLLTACKKPYAPGVTTTPQGILVVEGVINNGADSTIITLSRSIKLTDTTSGRNPELKAVLSVEDDQNASYPLKELTKGNYGTGGLTLNKTRQYRLRIKTADGLTYLSSFEAVKNAPPIDTVGYTTSAAGLSLYTGTHDAANSTLYYRWQFEETWIFNADTLSHFITNGKKIIPRTQLVYTCWGNNVSTSIILASTAKLSQDVITQLHLTDVPSNSEKVSMRYSVNVKELALTQKAYDFWQNMQRNTENLGSIFDQQPSAPVGNIQCVNNNSIPVIGYISVGTVQAKRIFIDRLQLPQGWRYVSPYGCVLKNYYYKDPSTPDLDNLVAQNLIPLYSSSQPIDALINYAKNDTLGFSSENRYCIDCRLRGNGSVTKPSFWK